MNYIISTILVLLVNLTFVSAASFTVSSYNCGGLSDHYDYLRAATMQQLMKERYRQESQQMALKNRMQAIFLKMIMANSQEEIEDECREWNEGNYGKLFWDSISESSNISWNHKVNQMITPYNVRPVVIFDERVSNFVKRHLQEITGDMVSELPELLRNGRYMMAKKIFSEHLNQDIICLQEADYLDESVFPDNYEVRFSESDHSVNGIAWNKDRFDLIKVVGAPLDRGFIIKLLDKVDNSIVAVASAHLTGCNPYKNEINPDNGRSDSMQGNLELITIMEWMEEQIDPDLLVIGMDSNVTPHHPRLLNLKRYYYQMDTHNELYATCTNPNLVLDTRIDFIAIRPRRVIYDDVSITNIPVLGVDLNNIENNISDHKPVAAEIICSDLED